MSEVEVTPVEVTAVEAVPVIQLTPKEALKQVVRNSLFHEGLARGLNEAVKALDRGTAHLAILSSACNENAYKNLIVALCKKHKIPLLNIADGKVLGEWCGLARLREDGTPGKLIGCSCAVIREWGVESEARAAILKHIESGATSVDL